MANVEEQILHIIQQAGRGWCFTPKHFIELGTSESVRKALSSLTQKHLIKRLAFGIYEYPRRHTKLGELPPNIDNVITAITEKDKVNYLPSGAYAANLLGISEQVPAKIVVLTAGTTKKITIGNTEILFKRTTPKNMLAAGTITGIIMQAFKFIGENNISHEVVTKVKRKLSKDDLIQLNNDLHLLPSWMIKIIKKNILGA